MSRVPKPDAGIMAVLIPFVILLLVLIALEPARASSSAAVHPSQATSPATIFEE